MSVPTHISDAESNVPHLEQEDVTHTTARQLHLMDHPLGQPLKGRSRTSVSQRTILNQVCNRPLKPPAAYSASPTYCFTLGIIWCTFEGTSCLLSLRFGVPRPNSLDHQRQEQPGQFFLHFVLSQQMLISQSL
jgi:hypothetical protein